VNHRKQTWTFVLMTLLLAVAVSGCGKKKVEPPPPPPPPPPKAATATISVNPASIQRGQSATLTWSTENAKTVTLQGATVAASGSQTVSPTQSTDYRVAAQGDSGTPEASSTARLTVTEPPPPPPPPVRQPSDDEIFSQSVQDIHFDYDKYDLRTEAQTSLTQTARTISQHPNWVVLIEGNCDERGSSEYNIGLGANRATSARDFLVKAGVNPNQLKTHSNGKEKPVCSEATEDCWQKNRNDHFSLSH
jgi:peptidoglycan-associated lipoprotein